MRLPYSVCRQSAILCLGVLLTTACTMPEWIGGSEQKVRLEGDRITLLESDSSIKVNASTANQQVKTPQARRNSRWYKAHGQHILTESNPRSPWELKTYVKVDAGEGNGDENYPLSFQPIIANGLIFVMDAEGRVSAFNAAHASVPLVWKTLINVPEDKINFVAGGIAYDQGKLFINTGYTSVIALDAKSGKLLWNKKLASATRSSPDARNGRVFVQTLDNKLYALSGDNGTIQWIHAGVEKDLTVAGAASPLALGETAIAAYSSGGMFALRSSSGKQIWEESLALSQNKQFNLLTDIDSTPVVSEGRLYAASLGGSLASFELFSGTRIWERELASSANLWVAGNFLYALSDQSELVAVHTLNGGVKWVASLPRFKNEEDKENALHWSGPVMSGSRILVVGSHGVMLAVSPFSGEIMQEYSIAGDVYGTAVSALGNIYLYDADANLHIYSGPRKQPVMNDFITLNEPQAGSSSQSVVKKETALDETTSAIGDFFTGFLKLFKAEQEDDAEVGNNLPGGD